MRSFKKNLIVGLIFSLTLSCSLNYGNEQSSESTVPEFSFTNANYKRYSNNKKSVEMQAGRLEQYKSDGTSYASNAEFKTYDDNGKVDTDGSCKLLAADTNKKEYSLFNDVLIQIYSQDMVLLANSLHFNGKTEQLTSALDEEVTIERKNTSVSGKGFSASGVSRTFSFASSIQGTVTEKDEEPDEEN